MAKARVAVDVGGTFTDLILLDEEKDQLNVHKLPSTVHDQSVAVVEGIEAITDKAGIPVSDLDYVLHGTTVATNITIERNGARVGMITTKNYRDILHIARHKKVHNFSLQQDIPWQSDPLVKRRHRKSVTEKIAAPNGDISTPLKEEDVKEAVKSLKASDVEVIFIGFMFSFLNDIHERRAKEIVNEMWPEVPCFTSTEVVPQIREYERFSTAAMNAYVAPKVSNYLDHLQKSLDKINMNGKLQVMQSSGGMATVDVATATPVSLLKSGPAGCALAASYWGGLEDIDNLISVDIGGTSADISVIPDREVKIINALDSYVDSLPVLTPMVDVETIGAGGGSIAYIDAGGAFRVGPRSAGANPGPACYNLGGTEPTVTDANVVLGRLDKEQFLGGDLDIDPELSNKAIEKLASKLNMSIEETALGVLKIINNNMALSIRASSVKKGTDPRNYSLFASGGAGPLHAVDLAEVVNAETVTVSSYPGVASAIGLLAGDLKYDYIKSRIARSDSFTDKKLIQEINEDFETLENRAIIQLQQDGISNENIKIERVAECRYEGQGVELRVDMPDGELDEEKMAEIRERFDQAHQNEYGHYFDGDPIEIITLRIISSGKTPPVTIPKLDIGGRVNPEEAVQYTRNTVFEINDEIESHPTPRYKREQLLAEDRVTGPAIIVQRDTTTLVPPNWETTISEFGTLLITKNMSDEPTKQDKKSLAKEM